MIQAEFEYAGVRYRVQRSTVLSQLRRNWLLSMLAQGEDADVEKFYQWHIFTRFIAQTTVVSGEAPRWMTALVDEASARRAFEDWCAEDGALFDHISSALAAVDADMAPDGLSPESAPKKAG